eukprot:TRINITY_DN10481_c0_g1_i1.p1 TRINITY_DN10481_c0_g1~~TRINITY_DN10481_c0_g1_i1.p1  ORF type:complete len:279 (-),score=52.40 TRINITY_DN10481_c0_g1_i1:251-1063(-)
MNEKSQEPSFMRYQCSDHSIIQTKMDHFFIISTLSTRNDSIIITIEPSTGSLLFVGINGVDIFGNEEEALDYLRQSHTISNITKANALIGFIAIGNYGNLLIATKIRKDELIYGGHIACTVLETKWIKMRLSYPYSPLSKDEELNLKSMKQFPLDGLHFYCETLDLTLPFPSNQKFAKKNDQFCWNDWLTQSFEIAGLKSCCVILLQGMIKSGILSNEESSSSDSNKKRNSLNQIQDLFKKENIINNQNTNTSNTSNTSFPIKSKICEKE